MPETPDLEAREMRSVLHSHTKVLNALRETQVEHGVRLDRVEGRLDNLELKVDQGFARADEQFAKLNIGMAEITTLLNRHLGEGG